MTWRRALAFRAGRVEFDVACDNDHAPASQVCERLKEYLLAGRASEGSKCVGTMFVGEDKTVTTRRHRLPGLAPLARASG